MRKIICVMVAALIITSIPIMINGCSGKSKGDSYMQISMDEAVDMMETEASRRQKSW